MRALIRLIPALGATLLALPASATELQYPEAPRGDTLDIYHGDERVADPWRWLEEVDSVETRRWVEAQQRLSDGYLAGLPGRAALQRRLEALWDVERYGVPETTRGWHYFLHNDGLQPQAVLYREPVAGGERQRVLDVNQLAEDGTTALRAWEVSPDGRYLAYGLAEAGSDWNRFRVRDLRSGRDLPEVLDFIKFSGMSWSQDSRGFFYSRYPGKAGTFDELANQAVYYHRVGTAQSSDVRVYAEPAYPRRGFAAEVDASGRWLLISVWEGASDNNRLLVRDLGDPQDPELLGPLRVLVPGFASRNQPLGVLEDTLYVHSTQDAPRGRVRALDLTHPRPEWLDAVDQRAETLDGAILAGGFIVAHYLRDAASVLQVYSPLGEPLYELTPPGLASIGSLEGQADSRMLFFSRASFLEARAVWQADLGSRTARVWKQPAVDFAAENYLTEQLFAESADGTRVPYFITRARQLKPDRAHPTWLYGYGGFNIPLTPGFKIELLPWLEAGGLYVQANLRGGGEYGEEWHRAGAVLNKQNVFDDFIAVAEDLIARGWTRPAQLAIHGRSNGGLLVGAVLNQRPELFGAAMPGVGVMDMLRFHKFTIGWAWTGDYGSSADAAQYRVLRSYSPYHNIRDGQTYPPVLVYTADHDDRVVPGHSFKYAAALQAADTGPGPHLIRIESRGGHGAGKPTAGRIAEARDLLIFAGHHLGVQFADKPGGARWERMLY